jgi:hypothetical protein
MMILSRLIPTIPARPFPIDQRDFLDVDIDLPKWSSKPKILDIHEHGEEARSVPNAN